MTDHTSMKMHREFAHIYDERLMRAILSMDCVASVAFHDEPYPYVIQMNYGYEWPEGGKLTLYFHVGMGEGHKFDLIAADPHVAVFVGQFLDRVNHKRFQREPHDFRSVVAYGTAEVINAADDPDEWLRGINALLANTNRPPLPEISNKNALRLQVLRIDCDIVQGKSQYHITEPEEVPMPSNEVVDAGLVHDPTLAQ